MEREIWKKIILAAILTAMLNISKCPRMPAKHHQILIQHFKLGLPGFNKENIDHTYLYTFPHVLENSTVL